MCIFFKFCRKVDSTINSRTTERFFVDAAIHSNPDPSKIDVITVGRNGVVYSFHNVSLSDGTLDSTHDQNTSVDIDVGSIRGTRIKCLENLNAKVNYKKINTVMFVLFIFKILLF